MTDTATTKLRPAPDLMAQRPLGHTENDVIKITVNGKFRSVMSVTERAGIARTAVDLEQFEDRHILAAGWVDSDTYNFTV